MEEFMEILGFVIVFIVAYVIGRKSKRNTDPKDKQRKKLRKKIFFKLLKTPEYMMYNGIDNAILQSEKVANELTNEKE
jgi:hypothetical protein